MTDYAIYDETNAPEASRPTLQAVKSKYGFIPNLLGEFAESPAAVEAYAALSGIYGKTQLSAPEQQIVLLTASFENDCTYCMAAHSTVAKGAGLSDEALSAIRDGRALPDVRQNALADFTRAIVRERGFAGQAAVDAFLAAGFTRANIFDVVTGVALKTMSNYTNHIAETPVDDAFAPQAWTKPAPALRLGK
jgi:uncharacterized peroxidase-related enzyme